MKDAKKVATVVAKKEVKGHEKRMHGQKFAAGGGVMRGAGAATKGKRFGGPLG
jgi:hypothetical protein